MFLKNEHLNNSEDVKVRKNEWFSSILALQKEMSSNEVNATM